MPMPVPTPFDLNARRISISAVTFSVRYGVVLESIHQLPITNCVLSDLNL